MSHVLDTPISDIVSAVKSGEITATELVREALERARHDKNHSLLELIEERAIEQAKEIDKKPEGKLAGVPFIAKDNFLTFGSKTTAASHMLGNFKAPFQSTAVERLEAEGAICIAKANLDAFAHGSSTENSDFGPTTNPHDETRVPGGSSGGSAASVALNIAPFALGTDTGGSIRLPASFTGTVGFKPTYGLVSRYGVVAMASSTDVIGPIARSVEDVALVFDVLAGNDWRDSTMIERDQTSYASLSKPKQLKIGVISEFMTDSLDSEVSRSTKEAIELLKQTGAEVEEVHIPAVEHSLACYYIIVPAEISSNLARFDGIRYGFSERSGESLDDVYKNSRTNGFGPEAKRRIMIGNYVLSSGYYDAYYKKAMQVRTLLVDQFNKAFEKYDVLVSPVAPTPAFKLGENDQDPLQMYLADIMTVGVSLVGAPAVSVPVRPTASGLPIGLQIIGAQRSDKIVLEVARTVEENVENG